MLSDYNICISMALLELEKLNTETAEINRLELELEDSHTTFRMLLNEATRRLKALGHRLGNCVEKARPYHEASIVAHDARVACQRAAVAYQHASEIHAAAKETVALAEQRFKSNQHEWQFDNAWQEMLNYATMKVMDAENQKAESAREHHKKALLFNAAESKMQQLEEQLKKQIIKSRPYFEEKELCQEQLATQKERIQSLENLISKAKDRYSKTLKNLEAISEEIHMKRKALYGDAIGECPVGPREPGVGAERDNSTDYSLELEGHDLNLRKAPTSAEEAEDIDDIASLEELRKRVRRLAARPVEGGATGDSAWETELNETVNKLDQMLMMRERAQQAKLSEGKLKPSPSHSLKSLQLSEKPLNDLSKSVSADNFIKAQQQESLFSKNTASKLEEPTIVKVSSAPKEPQKKQFFKYEISFDGVPPEVISDHASHLSGQLKVEELNVRSLENYLIPATEIENACSASYSINEDTPSSQEIHDKSDSVPNSIVTDMINRAIEISHSKNFSETNTK